MTGLWTPPGAEDKPKLSHWMNEPTTTEMECDSLVELHDSDIRAFEDGPLKWAAERQGQTLDIDRFTKDLAEQFAEIGFKVEVQVFQTNQPGAYRFKLFILARLDSRFDPDRQVHEVVNNLLEIPGEGGTIDTGKAMLDMEREMKERGGKHAH